MTGKVKLSKSFIIYVSSLIIPLLILGAILLLYFYSVIRNEAKDYEVSKMSSIQQLVEREFDGLKRIAINALFDQELSASVVKENEYNSKLACTKLVQYKNSSMLIHEVFLFYKGDESILSTVGKADINIAANKYFNLNGPEFEKLLEGISNPYTPGLLNLYDSENNTGEKSKGYITLIYSEPLNQDEHNATIILMINRNALENFINNTFGTIKGEILLFDEKGSEIITFGNNANLSNLQIDEALRYSTQSDIKDVEINGVKYYASKIISPLSGWQYAMAIPKADLTRDTKVAGLQLLWVMTAVVSAVCVLIIFITIYYYSFRKHLYSSKEYIDPSAQKMNKGEVGEVKSLLADGKSETHIEEKSFQQSLIKEEIIQKLLKGDFTDPSEIDGILCLYGMEFSFRYYRVLVISLVIHEIKSSSISYILYLIDVILKTSASKCKCYFIQSAYDEISIIANTEENDTTFLTALTDDILMMLNNKIGLAANIGAGIAYDSTEGIKYSFNEALSVLDYLDDNSPGKVILYEDIVFEENAAGWFPSEKLDTAAMSLKQGNLNSYLDAIDSIILEIKKKRLPSGLKQSVCFGMISGIVNLANEINSGEFKAEIETLTQFNGIDNLRARIEEVSIKICNYLNSIRKSGNQRIKEDILEFINRDFRSSMLSLETVSQALGISSGYLSRFFKERAGIKFIDYVKQLRINEAKKLLTETDMDIKDIVKGVGYNDTANFIRSFKAMEGITPGEYRKSNFQR